MKHEEKNMNGLSMRMVAGALAVAVVLAGCGDGGKKPVDAAKTKPPPGANVST